MKNRFIALTAEVMMINLLALFFIWKLRIKQSASGDMLSYIGQNAALIEAVVAVSIIIGAVQGYFYIVKPYTEKMAEMEKAVAESRKAEAIRTEFVANVSHELKTPLTSISGFIETLQDGAAEDPEVRTKFLDIIAIETARLNRLINDLLVLSDIENKRSPSQGYFNVREAVESTAEALRLIAQNKNIELITDLDGSIRINGSMDRFCQMMMNLIENAIKYSDDGSRVWIDAYIEDGRRIVRVRDEGIGISKEHHSRLFERFYRVDKSRSKKAGGTGLGLSIVKHIAVLLGARLEVESEIGKGTAFYVIFDRD